MPFDRTGHRVTENVLRATELNVRTVEGCLRDIRKLVGELYDSGHLVEIDKLCLIGLQVLMQIETDIRCVSPKDSIGE